MCMALPVRSAMGSSPPIVHSSHCLSAKTDQHASYTGVFCDVDKRELAGNLQLGIVKCNHFFFTSLGWEIMKKTCFLNVFPEADS